MKIYTKKGDTGETSLGMHGIVKKNEYRIDSLGDIDELNAHLGLVGNHVASLAAFADLIQSIQSDLFDIGAEITTKEPRSKKYVDRITLMETEIDRVQEEMSLLQNFILPGGSLISSLIHVARAVCRRAERHGIASLSADGIRYLNRLSDLLFVWARYFNNKGRNDILWKGK